MKSVLDDIGCQCGEPELCSALKCANCGQLDFQCNMRRSIRLVLNTDAPEGACYFCEKCWKEEDPDGY